MHSIEPSKSQSTILFIIHDFCTEEPGQPETDRSYRSVPADRRKEIVGDWHIAELNRGTSASAGHAVGEQPGAILGRLRIYGMPADDTLFRQLARAREGE
jgi:hypothetical protein